MDTLASPARGPFRSQPPPYTPLPCPSAQPSGQEMTLPSLLAPLITANPGINLITRLSPRGWGMEAPHGIPVAQGCWGGLGSQALPAVPSPHRPPPDLRVHLALMLLHRRAPALTPWVTRCPAPWPWAACTAWFGELRIESVGRGPTGQGRFIQDFEEAASSLVKLSRVGQARSWAWGSGKVPGPELEDVGRGWVMGSTFQAVLWAPSSACLDINRGLCDVEGNHLIPPPFL